MSRVVNKSLALEMPIDESIIAIAKLVLIAVDLSESGVGEKVL